MLKHNPDSETEQRWDARYSRAPAPLMGLENSMLSVDELRKVLDHLPLAVFVDNSPTECLFSNRAYKYLYGIDASESTRDEWPAMVDQEAAQEEASKRRRLWANGEPYAMTAAATTVDGPDRWIWQHVTPVLTPEGKVVRAIGVMIDVTERVEATRALEESERQFRGLVTNSGDAVVGIDSQHCVTIWNETAVAMFGYEADEIVGRSIELLLPADAAKGNPALVSGFFDIEDGRVPVMNRAVRARRKDGTEFVIEVGLAKIRLGDEQLAVATIRDVSNRERVLAERRQGDAKFRALVQHNVDAIFVIGQDDLITYVSPAVEAITGYPPEDMSGLSLTLLISQVHRDDRATMQREVDSVRAEVGAHHVMTYRQRHREGGYRTLEARVTNYFDVEGLNALVVNVRDISESVAMAAELRIQNEELQAILSAFPDQLYRVNRDGLVVDSLATNDAGALSASRLVGRRVSDVVPGDVGMRFMDAIRAVSDDRHGRAIEYEDQELGARGGGSFEARFSPLPDGDVLAAIRDMSARARMQQQLTYRALHDDLTGLPNRLLLADELQQALLGTATTPGRLAVLFLDLDGFKRVNDSLGHAAGDELLVGVAHRLRAAVRPRDIVARIGGDEFVIMCDELRNEVEAELVAERIRKVLIEPVFIAGTQVVVSASIGIALAGPDGFDADTLLAHADAAMYRAKDQGRARAEVFDTAMRDSLDRRIDIENGLRSALEAEDLTVHFQPIVNGLTGRISGAEALARWTHPLHGRIDPDEFVVIAEESGLVVSLDNTILRLALKEARQWPAIAGTPILLTVNMSARHVADPDFASGLLQEVHLAEVDPSLICVEITETAVLHASDDMVEDLRSLRDAGMQIAIDDFGTGYSSLSSLRSMPVSSLKVDQSFVAGLQHDKADAAIVRATIDLAHEFGLWVIAEGVENAEQMSLLRSMACDSMQGFFIARPMPADGISALLAQHRRW